MAKDKETAGAADIEAAEIAEMEAVADEFEFTDVYYAGGDCRDVMLEIIKRRVNWSVLKEAAQRDIIGAVENAAATIVAKVARAVHAQGRPEYAAKLEKLVIKDGLQLTLKGPFDVDSVDMLAKAQGGTVLVIMQSAESYDHARGLAEFTPDQPGLLIPQGDDDLVAAGDPTLRKVVRIESTGDLKVVHAESGGDLGEPTDAEREAFIAAEDAARQPAT